MMDPIHPTPIISVTDAGVSLGLARAQGARLAHAGFFGRIWSTPSGAEFVEQSAVDTIRSRPLVTRDLLQPAIILRAGPPAKCSTEWQSQKGFHLSMDHAEITDSALRYWPVRDPESLDSVLIVIAVAGVTGWTGRIRGYETAPGGLVAFRADPDTSSAEAVSYQGIRLDLHRGPLIDRIGV